MSNRIKIRNCVVDQHSQVILSFLANSGGAAPTRELKDAADLDQPQQIHYRHREHLGDGNLDFTQREKVENEHGQDEWMYSITEEGRKFVAHYEDELRNAIAASKALDTIEDMRDRMDEWGAKISEINETHSEMQREINNKQSQFHNWKQKTRAIRDDVEGLESELEQTPTYEQLDFVAEELANLEGDVDQLESDIDRLSRQLSGVSESIQTLIDAEKKTRQRQRQMALKVNELIGVISRAAQIRLNFGLDEEMIPESLDFLPNGCDGQ